MKLTYLICHCGREQHGLSVEGTQSDDLFHLLLKILIQHPENKHIDTDESQLNFRFALFRCQRSPVSLVQDQDFYVSQLKAWCIVKMINQPTRCSNQNIWPCPQSCLLRL